MMLKERKGINPLLIKFGIALALSFAGFLYSRIRTKRIKPPQSPQSPPPLPSPPPPPPPPDYNKQFDSRSRAEIKDDSHGTQRIPSCHEISSISIVAYEGVYVEQPKGFVVDPLLPNHVYKLKKVLYGLKQAPRALYKHFTSLVIMTLLKEKPFTQVSVDICSANPSPSSRHSSDKNRFLLPEFDNLIKEFNMDATITVTSPMKEVETPKSNEETPKTTKSIDRYEYEQEIQNLKNMVGILREKERHLEIKLLEYYGLKEQETAVMELQNRLKINSVEAKLFSLKIESLQADNRRLEAQVSDYSKVVAELEAAKAKIKLLWKKLRSEAEENKEQILNLKQRVAKLQEHDHDRDTDIESRLQRANELEVQNDELRKSNFDLQLENSELASRLESTQILATSFLDDQETEELRKEVIQLRQENNNLAKEIERLQSDRCADVEEVVYLRWINACLRYELRNYQPAPGKMIARDLSKSLSPRSEEKAKQLILEYANTEEGAGQRGITTVDFDLDQWSSSPSNATDSPDNSASDLTSSTNKTHTLSKTKFFGKLRRLIRGHHHHHDHDHHESPSSPIGNAETGDAERSSEARSLRNRTSSQNSNRSSMVLGRLGSLNEEDTKESGSVRSGDSGSSHGYRRFVLGMESADKDLDGTRVSDVVKFAEVLRGSHRRAASCGP